MERHAVIGTAGHIDHGKTTLVKALTGVDTDRLAEEKARGITIDLGFAPLDLDGLPASVVDVPGHEAFIRNMLAGATGIDAALLVIAADEGVMPQTVEHLAILGYLGVERGVVALTKADLVQDEDWLGMVRDDARRAVGGRQWAMVNVSASTGAGLPELRAALRQAALGAGARRPEDRFRMPVDRVFGLAGAGTVATGTVWSGTLREGDFVTILPGGHRARVRSIETHGRGAPVAEPGRRVALALVGVDKQDLARGSVILQGDGWRASHAADVVATFSGAIPKVRSRVHLHHGTAEVVARIARIAHTPSSPSTPSVSMRLAFDTPLVLRAGDRLVMRSWSPVTTIGGAIVTDPWADDLDRAHRRTIADSRLPAAAFIARRGPRGMTRTELEAAAGTPPLEGLLMHGDWLVAPAEVAKAEAVLSAALERYHRDHPLATGMPAQAWRDVAGGPPGLAALAEERLTRTGGVVREGSTVRLPGFSAASSDAARSGMEQVLATLVSADAEPPSVSELAALHPGLDVAGTLRHLAREGRIVAVADRYYVTAALARERLRLEETLQQLGAATPAAIRERLGRSRKWLIPFLEWADREGVTVRDGDRRRLNLQAGA